MGAVCLGLYMLGMDLTVLNTLLPDLHRDLDLTAAQAQWVVDGYALALGGLVLSTGGLTERVGRRRAYVGGLLVCAAASALGALATTSHGVIAARVGMGVGAALFMPATLSIVSGLFPEPALRRQAIAVWAVVAGLGMLTGPVVAGLLVSHFSWHSGFWINVPLALISAALAALLVPTTGPARRGRTDVPGAVLSAAGLTTLVWALIEAPGRGWTSLPVTVAFALATALLATFAVRQCRTADPMLPPALLRDRRVSGGAAAVALVCFALAGSLFVVTLYLQSILRYDPWEAGLRLLPQGGALVIGSASALPLLRRFHEKVPVVLGLLLIAGALAVWSSTTSDSGYPRLLVVQLVAGTGAGLVATAGTEAVMHAVSPWQAALGSAVNDASRQVGSVLGIAVQGSILATVYPRRLRTHLDQLPQPVPTLRRPTPYDLPGTLDLEALPPGTRAAAATAVRHAFIEAMNVTALSTTCVILATTITVAYALPGPLRRPAPAFLPTAEQEGVR